MAEERQTVMSLVQRLSELLNTAGGNLLILCFFDFALLIAVGNPWFHYSDDIDKMLQTLLAGFFGATLQALQSGMKHKEN